MTPLALPALMRTWELQLHRSDIRKTSVAKRSIAKIAFGQHKNGMVKAAAKLIICSGVVESLLLAPIDRNAQWR